MKQITLAICLLFMLINTNTFGQTIDCKKQLVAIKTNVKQDRSKLSDLVNQFKNLKTKLSDAVIVDSVIDSLKITQKSISDLKKEINKKIDNFESLKAVCLSNNAITEEDVKTLTKDLDLTKFKEHGTEVSETTEKQTYIYFNKDQIIKEDVIKNDNVQGKILNDIISQTNQESYLGDVTIPMDGEEFYFYKSSKRADISMKSNEYVKDIKKYKFKSIDIQIYDGNFYDIRLKIEYNNQIYLFENFISISFFRFNKMARDNYLIYSNKQPYGIEGDLSDIQDLKVRLSDVLYYEYKIGNNYIPSDLLLELPKNDIDNKQTNLDKPTTYQIKEDTYLDKIIELRAYTDFLALFNDSNNGLLQIEGSAKFYIFPFSRQLFNYTGQFELLKSATPYVNYARFEDNNRLAEASMGFFNQELDVIEKRYLTMGVKLNMVEIYHKNYPIKASIFSVADYNISKAQSDMLEPENIKSFGYGFGFNIATKRFNNFGFSYNMEFKWFDLESFNTTNNINTNLNIPVFKNEAEVFYHPTDNPNQAIFVRLRTFNYKGNSNNQAFYQFQFGYKFSLGSRTVKK